jgi:excisionase family DNA binding protein
MTDTTKYVTTAAVAEHFGVSPATITMLVRNGDIPTGTYTRMGRVFRFDLARVEAALLEKQKAPDSAQLEFNFTQPTNDGE